MTNFENILIIRNEIANQIQKLVQSVNLSEQDEIFILESILNDTRMRCMTREAYIKAAKEAKEEQEIMKKVEELETQPEITEEVE